MYSTRRVYKDFGSEGVVKSLEVNVLHV